MDLLHELQKRNTISILPVTDASFATYGRVLLGYDLSPLESYMETTEIPQEGNVYVASVDAMETMAIAVELRDSLYGGMPIQVGYCNGKNSSIGGFEYHKGSEVNVAVTDFMLCLGHSYDIVDNTYDVEKAQIFFVPKGTVIEMYSTTLHLSPIRVWEEGFRGIVILPAGTNTPLSAEEKARCNGKDAEQRLLLQRNKWVIAHPEREPLIRQGAHPGVIGENKCVNYYSIL